MGTNSPKQILLFVAGMTPQIITETLYALTQERGECVDEIRVITTLGGRDKLLKTLLDPEHGKFLDFCRDYGIDPATIKFDETTITLLRTPDGRTLKDIRTREENDYAADQICEIVRELARDDNTRIHASAAGGRKTMSIYLTTAMQLFGRGFDRLSHVLVSEDFETHPDFFYIPPEPRELEIRDRQGNFIKKVSTSDAEIHLADIPFIRLRGLRSDWLDHGGYSYGRLVEQAQKDLDLSESLHDLRIDLVRRVVSVAGFSVVLSKREMFFYAMFARLCRNGRGFIRPSEINVEILDETFRSITSATGGERPLAEYDLVPGYDFLIGMLNDLEHNYEVFQKTFLQIRSRINRKLSEAGIRGLYLIEARGGYSETGYGITVAPDRVILG
ncbi:MAG: TIGR02584 family CRISPR-associated protein [Acidobacteriota bacterium]|nr:MAG: TIGR02584 family CRISPR-associated protein [Acidobacteriota bacterium]